MPTQGLNASLTAKQCNKTVKAASARSAGDGVYLDMDTDGYVDLTIASNAAVHIFAVAPDVAVGKGGNYTTEGEVTLTVPSGTYTAGNGLKVTTGVIVDSAGAFAAAGLAGDAQLEFGVIKVGGVSVTEITVVLHGLPFTSA